MPNPRYAVIMLAVLLPMSGCSYVTLGEPRKDLDFAATAKDQELTIKQITTLDPDERARATREQNELRYKWSVDIRTDPKEEPASIQADGERVKAFDRLLEMQLRQSKQ